MSSRCSGQRPVTRFPAEADPPPNTRHLALRTGKRVSQDQPDSAPWRDLARAIAECRYLLREPDPDGALVAAGRVGLITHKDCERATAEALGISAHRTGHVWGMRGSNALEDYEVLLVVGAPAVRPEQVARLACAYYYEDP